MTNLHHTTAEERLRQIVDNSVDGIISDYPYGLKFMGKKWDYDLPSVESIEGQFRVLKPGAFLFGFSSSRTYHRLVCRLEDAGFEIRDCIMWMYGSGFPKGKACLKPAYEPIVVCRKPGKVRPLNIDESRIDTNWQDDPGYRPNGKKPSQTVHAYGKDTRTEHWYQTQGRWPANIIIDSKIVNQLDEQSGISGGDKRLFKRGKLSNGNESAYGAFTKGTPGPCYQDTGGASRFFQQIDFEDTDFPPFYYCGKACPSDRNYGMGNDKNTHPTVKPVKLMRYLARLMKDPNNPDFTIHDYYMGSGTTGVGCALEGISFEGTEMQEDSFNTAKRRIEYANEQYLKTQDLFSKAG